MDVKDAMEVVTKAIKEDPYYAWSWHCNVAMASIDEGFDHEKANKAAARFMQWCFGVDTSKTEYYKLLGYSDK